MKHPTELAQRLDEIYSGEPWFGESILTKVKDLPEATAFQQPKMGEHSIAELITHMEFWRKSLLLKIKNESVVLGMDHPDNWPSIETLKKRGWTDILKTFDQTHTTLVGALKEKQSFPEELWIAAVGTFEHDVYHLGQIGTLKKLIN